MTSPIRIQHNHTVKILKIIITLNIEKITQREIFVIICRHEPIKIGIDIRKYTIIFTFRQDDPSTSPNATFDDLNTTS
jgi:hypothetical protein